MGSALPRDTGRVSLAGNSRPLPRPCAGSRASNLVSPKSHYHWSRLARWSKSWPSQIVSPPRASRRAGEAAKSLSADGATQLRPHRWDGAVPLLDDLGEDLGAAGDPSGTSSPKAATRATLNHPGDGPPQGGRPDSAHWLSTPVRVGGVAFLFCDGRRFRCPVSISAVPSGCGFA